MTMFPQSPRRANARAQAQLCAAPKPKPGGAWGWGCRGAVPPASAHAPRAEDPPCARGCPVPAPAPWAATPHPRKPAVARATSVPRCRQPPPGPGAPWAARPHVRCCCCCCCCLGSRGRVAPSSPSNCWTARSSVSTRSWSRASGSPWTTRWGLALPFAGVGLPRRPRGPRTQERPLCSAGAWAVCPAALGLRCPTSRPE